MAIELFKYEDAQLKKGLEEFSEKVGAACLILCSTRAQKIESSMKINRRWTDRTGYAKQRLSARVSRPEANIIRITCSQGVDYGIWLELAHNKKYAIIAPTIQKEGPMLMAEMNYFMSQIKIYNK